MARKNKPLPEVAWLQPRLALSRAISLGSFVGLVLLILIRDLIYADAHGAASWVPWLVLAFKLLPLLVVAPGLLMGSARGHAGLLRGQPVFHPRRTRRLRSHAAPVRLGRSATQRDLVLRRAALYALAIPVRPKGRRGTLMVRQEPLLPCLRRFPVPTAGKPADSQRSGIAGAWMERRIEGGHFLPQAKPKDCGTAMREFVDGLSTPTSRGFP